MSGTAEFTGTEVLIMRAAIYAYELARKLQLHPATLTAAELDRLPFLAQVVRLDEAVQQAIEGTRSGNNDREHTERRLIGEISSQALSAARGYRRGPLDSFDQTELSNALFSLGQAVGHVEVVHGPLGRLEAELVEKRIKKNSDTAKMNSARSSWQGPAILIFNRLAEERPQSSKETLRADAIAELNWPAEKGKSPPNAEALRKAIAKRKNSSV